MGLKDNKIHTFRLFLSSCLINLFHFSLSIKFYATKKRMDLRILCHNKSKEIAKWILKQSKNISGLDVQEIIFTL